MAMDRRHQTPDTAGVDTAALADALRHRIHGEVRFDAGSRALYSTAGANYRQVPIGVVCPKDKEDIINTVALCREFDAPILARGGGTALAGQTCNIAVIMDMSKYYNAILDLDPSAKRARIQPGIVLDELRGRAEEHHLTYGPDPATHNHCTLGGMIGNNSCGVHSVMAGKTVDNVFELEILTYDGHQMTVGPTSDKELEEIINTAGRRGQIYAGMRRIRNRYADLIRERYPKIPRRVSGYNLDELLPESGFNVARALVGTEGTCVTILEATVRLVDSPPVRSLVVLGYPDVYSAGDHIMEVMEHKPTALEGIDDRLIDNMKKKGLHPRDLVLLPPGNGWLLVEFGGQTRREADDRANAMMEALKQKNNAPTMKLFDDRKQEKMVWTIRESGLGATAWVPGAPVTWEGWEDSAVPPETLGNYLRDFRALLERFGYMCDLYGHFGQGCVHTRIDFDLETKDGIAKYRSFIDNAADLVVKYGGSLSGEHGDGQSRAALLPKMFGETLVRAFGEFKDLWDPTRKMNPHKVVDPYQPDENLRLGADYAPWDPPTHFEYPEDTNKFSRATLRCVGVGECRKHGDGTMCPSYMVTREEMHSTRGRARLLFEMLEGQVIGKNGWRDEHVKEALDLCLACKGCKGECPVNVDMATYKAEFLSHYYEGRLRPRSAYAFGLIDRWARIASIAPDVANFFTQTAPFSSIAKAIAGVAPERQIPLFAREPFRTWFAKQRRATSHGATVMLWPDTFTNYFHPKIGQSAVAVLEDAGFNVVIPRQRLCCGRPLYDFGMLDRARKLLQEILAALRTEIREGMSIVGLEPSCIAVFRDELGNLLARDEDAKRLGKQVYTLAEFLKHKAPHYKIPTLHKSALYQGHCHHKAIMKTDTEEDALTQMGIELDAPKTGCCGMAGSFGFERGEQYDVSIKAGERALLPKVRVTPNDALIIADGFSCREQIAQCTGRAALHFAEVITMAIKERQNGGTRGEGRGASVAANVSNQ